MDTDTSCKNIFRLHQLYNLPKKNITDLYSNIPNACTIVNGNDRKKAIHILYNMENNSQYEYDESFTQEITKNLPYDNNVISNEQCKKCKAYKVITYTLQTRAADEPETVFTICWNCNHKTRH